MRNVREALQKFDHARKFEVARVDLHNYIYIIGGGSQKRALVTDKPIPNAQTSKSR
jgi:hypothetical protein